MESLEIRHCGIVARRTPALSHSLIDLSAFNTDGFDVAGRNVWIHDCNIWTQDDAISVKDRIVCPRNGSDGLAVAVPSENMLFERINASGLGLVVGSIGDGLVRNITFRDCYLRDTVKGIYLKFRTGQARRAHRSPYRSPYRASLPQPSPYSPARTRAPTV